ncbi:MAG TPA: hypothetical protein VGQ86_01785 [Candidatus Limnocylindria bacterium]|nr:hypothetical protein [Candidatus Limnocylindria bacterium]
MRDPGTARIVLLSLALLVFRLLSTMLVAEPGYTDAYYYADVAARLARGDGLTADFVWNFIEAPAMDPLPVASHRFWVPLATIAQAGGIALFGPWLGPFRAAQLALVIVAAFIPLVTYRAARSLGASEVAALVAAAIAGLGGLLAPGYVAADSFAIAALVGTLFFLAFAGAAIGSARAGALAGLLVGLLFLARTEAALFGLALLALAVRPTTRRAGTIGSAVALAIGIAWLARDAALGLPGDLFARTALLVHYEDFFAIASPTLAAFVAAMPSVIAAKLGALATNAVVLVFGLFLVLAPLAGFGAWRLRARADVRAWSALLVLVYLAQSLVWTEHSIRGSFFHAIAAFLPFGVALAVAAAERALAARAVEERRVATAGMLVASVAVSAFAVVQWDATFGAAHRERAAAVEAIPSGTFLAIDAAAWRWIADRPVVVTPADGLGVAACAVGRYRATSIVLEMAHFRAYDALYRGDARPAWLGPPITRGSIEIFPVIASADVGCSFSR